MRLTARNIVANVAGSGGGAAITLLATPLFFLYFGADRYGVILFMLSLAGLVSLIDLGLATTVNRRMAELRGGMAAPAAALDLLKTSAAYYTGMSVLVGGAISLLAPWLVTGWLDVPAALQDDAVLALRLWGGVLAMRWPLNLLGGVLNGLERQVALNLVTFIGSVARTAGVLLVAWGWKQDVSLYAAWYAALSAAELAALVLLSRRALPRVPAPARVSLAALSGVGAFTAGVAITTLAAAAIKYLDKLVVSGAVPVRDFALYQSIFLLASGLTLVSAAVMRAYYPHLTRAKADPARHAASYHMATRLIANSTAPLAGFMVVNAVPILALWTQSDALAAQGWPLLCIVIAAMTINSVMQAPQYLLWSAGLSKLTAMNNVVALVFVVPLTLLLIPAFGLVGGASVWLAYNIGYFTLFPHFLHRHVLPGEKGRWYRADVGLPFAAALAVFGAIGLAPLSATTRLVLSAMALLAFFGRVAFLLLRGARSER